jgi:hypothetical protein
MKNTTIKVIFREFSISHSKDNDEYDEDGAQVENNRDDTIQDEYIDEYYNVDQPITWCSII